MTFFDAIILGIVQGLTEFLPVSSSGHLIVVGQLLGRSFEGALFFDVALHLATLLAVVIYFWKDIWRLKLGFWYWLLKRAPMQHDDRVLLWAILLGTIPAVILGLWAGDFLETVFRSATVVAVALIAGSILFIFAEKVGKQTESLTVKKGFIIGIFQALALVPGMSRSGSTIAGGLIFGLSREMAAKFSFFLAMPIILGAGVVKLLDTTAQGAIDIGPVIVGSIAAFIVGITAIHYLLKYLRSHSLYVFVWYRVALALLLLIFL